MGPAENTGYGNSIVVMCSQHDPGMAMKKLSNNMANPNQLESSHNQPRDETDRQLVPVRR
jgi:hypothetical protein